MNTKGNKRAIETRNKIKWVFLNLLEEKEPEKITVSEICAHAQIHRTTFYGHYDDIPALMRELIGEMYKQIMEFFLPENGSIVENGFIKLFEFIKEHAAFFQYYFHNSRFSEQREVLLPNALQNKLHLLLKRLHYASEEELLYHQTFFCAGLIAVIERWLTNGCIESPEEMNRMIENEYSSDKTLLF